MRRYQKKRLKEKFQYLHNGHQLIAELLVSNQDISSVLAECQTLAIEIGNEIESNEGCGTKVVTILEQYCELLYGFSIKNLPTKQVKSALSVKKQLGEKISEAEKSFEEDITEQTEVVFFPYKASMWDSMETVWRKYKQDNNAKCIVVPLPYYIKDNNKIKIKKCYEGADFPADVEITDYEQYLRENHYSDIAIYHNPYDATNTITEVDSRFFTSEYHKYADILIYIPYYVLIDKPSIGFILAPGVKNADYVILQDNETAQEFAKWYPNQQDKFLPLGSPKIEKAVQMNGTLREELDIPQEWKDRIRGKKVLFYNTHLVNFMDKSRDFISKLKSVFETMQSQDNVVLWWRPHPLSEDMEYSADKERFREYEELVEWYRRENIGIYDDTPKLHEAIAASDAYYGDGSSLVKLFQAVGKPVMVQKCSGKEIILFGEYKRKYINNIVEIDNENYVPMMHNACVAYGKIWYLTYYNGLFCIDVETGKQTYEGLIPNTSPDRYFLYRQIVSCNNKIVMIPFDETRIITYDIDEKCFRECKLGIGNKQNFISASVYKNDVYLIPARYETVVKYSTEKNTAYEIISLKETLHILRAGEWISNSSCIVGDSLFFTICNTNHLVEYCILKDSIQVWDLLQNGIIYSSIYTIDEGIFAVARNKEKAFYWKPSDNKFMEFNFKNLYRMYKEKNVATLISHKGKVSYTPLYTNQKILFDIYTGKMEKVVDTDADTDGKIYGVPLEISEYISCIMAMGEQKFLIFSNGKTIVLYDKDIIVDLLKDMLKQKIVYENGDFNLETYLFYIERYNFNTEINS